jgi:hypothetical protein
MLASPPLNCSVVKDHRTVAGAASVVLGLVWLDHGISYSG